MTSNRLKSNLNVKDILLGILLILLATGALYVNQDYERGSASRMGPGYVPMLVFGLIGLFGLLLLVTALRSGPEKLERWAWRPMILILSSLAAFGVFLDKIGLGLSVALLTMVSSLADKSQTLRGAGTLTAILVLLCWVVFDRGLKLSIPFFPPFLVKG